MKNKQDNLKLILTIKNNLIKKIIKNINPMTFLTV